MQLNENENITHQHLLEAANVILRGKFIAWNTYTRKKEKSHKSRPN